SDALASPKGAEAVLRISSITSRVVERAATTADARCSARRRSFSCCRDCSSRAASIAERSSRATASTKRTSSMLHSRDGSSLIASTPASSPPTMIGVWVVCSARALRDAIGDHLAVRACLGLLQGERRADRRRYELRRERDDLHLVVRDRAGPLRCQ